MRAVVQRVTFSKVTVEGRITGQIDRGYNVLLGVMDGDEEKHAELLARKIAMLRVFEDENGKMNKSLLDVDGSVLAISQFTICADIKKGNRPSFTLGAEPERANRLYDYFCLCLEQNGIKNVQKGVFGADMAVDIQNEGPVTILMDTDIWMK